MTNKAIQKLLATNCDKIANLISEMYNALDEFDDDELSEITSEWLDIVDQCVNVDQGDSSSLYDSLDYLDNIEE